MIAILVFLHILERLDALVQFESRQDSREMLDFVGSVHDQTPSARRCGFFCQKAGWCKTYNHNPQLALCELIVTDLRLLGEETVPTPTKLGWKFYSTVPLVRGCGSLNSINCAKLMVSGPLEILNPISLSWTVADRGDRIQFGSEHQIMTVVNEEHPTQLGVVAANQIAHLLDSDVREFVCDNELNVPGVLYKFELNHFFNNKRAQVTLYANESTFPSDVSELEQSRSVTEHSLHMSFVFIGSAEKLDIWTDPSDGSCPCQFNPIGVTSHLIEGLEAGREYTHYMQLTSAYGKKGAVTSFVQSTFTDVITNSTETTEHSVLLDVKFESGVGNKVKLELKGELGSIQREYFYEF
ncbi:uncharacterized protein LOC142357530, partial [Convolutriloba macropyga]|uniref:uncharacterized protein LOC142357530 n=1 Tax=Convolutriloba macropyga TaxID=536237 RepID=UPI003F521698